MNNMIDILRHNELDHASQRWTEVIERTTANDVQRELSRTPGHFSLNRLAVLLSPAAQEFLETMAQQARSLTTQRFGRTVQLYVPLYLSNHCCNSCLYCGYNTACDFPRTRLTIDQALREADYLADRGFRHLLLLSGEDPDYITPDFLGELAGSLRNRFSSVSVEIYPLSEDGYRKICTAGIDGVTLYQETYHRDIYAHYHIAGPKSDYESRVTAPDRFAAAGMRRFGLGVLLGLADWRLETLALARHGAYLMKKYWQGQVSFSFPRIRPAQNVGDPFDHLVSDEELVQMMLALRLCFADAGIVLSTRESPRFRDHMTRICVTRLSAGSKTNPGGYASEEHTAEQFTIHDDRSPAQIADMIRSAGLEPVWKDWDPAFTR